jgi:hypothetical protein
LLLLLLVPLCDARGWIDNENYTLEAFELDPFTKVSKYCIDSLTVLIITQKPSSEKSTWMSEIINTEVKCPRFNKVTWLDRYSDRDNNAVDSSLCSDDLYKLLSPKKRDEYKKRHLC